jgi:hypothetical protein
MERGELLAAATAELKRMANQLHPRDCPRVKRWLRSSNLERFDSADDAIRSATKTERPHARDWTSFLAFIKEMIPIFMAMFAK